MARPTRSLDDEFFRWLDQLERRVRDLERESSPAVTFDGPRTDLPSGRGPRVRVGLLADGTSYGIQRWSSSGTPQTVTWS